MRILLAFILSLFLCSSALAAGFVGWVPLANSSYSTTGLDQKGITLQYEDESQIVAGSFSIGKSHLVETKVVPLNPSNLPIQLGLKVGGQTLNLNVPNVGTYKKQVYAQDMTFNLDYRKKVLSYRWKKARLYVPRGSSKDSIIKYRSKDSFVSLSPSLGWRYSRVSFLTKHSIVLANGNIRDSITNPLSNAKDGNSPTIGASVQGNYDFLGAQISANTDVLSLTKVYWLFTVGASF